MKKLAVLAGLVFLGMMAACAKSPEQLSPAENAPSNHVSSSTAPDFPQSFYNDTDQGKEPPLAFPSDADATEESGPFLLAEGGYPGKHQYGNFLFQNGTAFLFGEDCQTIYRVKDGTSLKLYGPEEDRVYLTGLCEQNGFLYFKRQQDLYRISVDGGEPEPLLHEIGEFDVYANMIYVTLDNGDGGLFAVDSNDTSHIVELEKKASIIAAVEGGVIYRVSEANPDSEHPEQIYYHQSNGERKLLDVVLYGSPFEVHGDEIYYRDTIERSDGSGYYNRICQYNYITGDERIIYSQNSEQASDGIQNFTVYDDCLYIYQDEFVKVKLDGSDSVVIMNYDNYSPSHVNGVIESIHLFSIASDKNYIYLYGKAINGHYLTTRFPIEGTPEGKQEEVFYEGYWILLKEYYDSEA